MPSYAAQIVREEQKHPWWLRGTDEEGFPWWTRGTKLRPNVPAHVGGAPAWGAAEYAALAETARAIGARPLDVMLVLYSESGLDPAATAYVNGAPYALGLNQITPPAAKAIGLSDDEWAALPSMSVVDQLPIVTRSLRASMQGRSSVADAGQLYQANFAPATLSKGSSDDVVLYRSPSGGYVQNAPLDKDKKGYINVGDMRRRLSSVAAGPGFQAHAARARVYLPGAEGPVIGGGSSTGSKVLWVLGFAGVAAFGVYAWKKGLRIPKLSRPSSSVLVRSKPLPR